MIVRMSSLAVLCLAAVSPATAAAPRTAAASWPTSAPVSHLAPLTTGQLARKSVRVAAVQVTGPWNWLGTRPGGDPPLRPGQADPADVAVTYIERAAKDRADLVAFPELFLGYFPVPSPATDKVAAAARQHGVNVMIGCFEVIEPSGTYRNTTLVFDRTGAIVGRYCKTHPAIGEIPYLWPPLPDDPEWTMDAGPAPAAIDLDFGRVSIVTCYDGYFPEAWRAAGLQGGEIIVWMNARFGAVEDYMVKTASDQNVCHVITTNKAVGTGTMICRWPHQVVAEMTEAKEGYISADLPLDSLRATRRFDRLFQQRRPELYGPILAAHHPIADQYAAMDSLPAGFHPPQLSMQPAAATSGTAALFAPLRAIHPAGGSTVLLGLADTLLSGSGALAAELGQPTPAWIREPSTGELYAVRRLSGGLTVTVRALPRQHVVDLRVSVANSTSETVGALRPVGSAVTTPPLGSVAGTLLRVTGLVSTTCSLGLAWEREAFDPIAPGATATLRGRAYLLPEPMSALLRRYETDRDLWNRTRP